MTILTRPRLAASLLLICLGALPVSAQQEPETAPTGTEAGATPAPEATETTTPPPPKKGFWSAFEFDAGMFLAAPSGLEFEPAAQSTLRNDGFNQFDMMETSINDELAPYLRLGIRLPKETGTLSGKYYSVTFQGESLESTPGQYHYAELQVVPYASGYFDDGFADAFASDSRLQIRDWQINFRRRAVDTPHVEATWHAGLRGVFVRREMRTAYYSLLQPPDDPIAFLVAHGDPQNNIPPRPDLAPIADVGYTQSAYDGTGVNAGIDARFPFGEKGTFSIEGGIDAAVLAGSIDTQYTSVTSYYASDGVNITQVTLPLALDDQVRETGSLLTEIYAGFRVRLPKHFEIFAGYRDIQYPETAAERRFGNPTSAGATNFATMTTTTMSPELEGFYFGFGLNY